MSETTSTPEPATNPIDTTAPPARTTTVVETSDDQAVRRGPSKLNVAAAWVGIVAGVVFVVAVIFGTGFMLGVHAGGHHGGGHRDGGGQMHHQSQMFGPGPGERGGFGPGGPGAQGPGEQGPGAFGPGPQGPGAQGPGAFGPGAPTTPGR